MYRYKPVPGTPKVRFHITPALSAKKKVEMDARLLNIPEGFARNLRWNLVLDPVGKNGSVINWKSNNTEYISHEENY